MGRKRAARNNAVKSEKIGHETSNLEAKLQKIRKNENFRGGGVAVWINTGDEFDNFSILSKTFVGLRLLIYNNR